jgi:hypothetical protein
MVKQSYRARPLFIGWEGGRFKEPPRDDHCAFSGGRVSTLTFQGWRFFTEIQEIVRGNGSSELTRFPEGLVLGNWAKTFYARNVGADEFVKVFVNGPSRRGFVSWHESIHEGVSLLLSTDSLTLWRRAKLPPNWHLNHMSISYFRKQESDEFGKPWIRESRSFEGISLRLQILKISSKALTVSDIREWRFGGSKKDQVKNVALEVRVQSVN